MQDVVKVLVADAHPLVRWALREFLNGRGNFEVTGEAGSVAEALSLLRSREVDVVITDLSLTDGSAAEVAAEFAKQGMPRVLAFSQQDTWDRVQAFLDAGGLGFVPKRSSLNELVEAVQAVANNRRWISPSVRAVVPAANKGGENGDCALSTREREIVSLVAKGLTSKQIADQLCVSLKTIESHRYRVFKKLNIQRVAQLADYAVKHGL